MNPKVSVIVPVYGAEAFLPTCISSLRAQTLRDIELIFVCDGKRFFCPETLPLPFHLRH